MNERFVQTPHEPDQIALNGLVAGKSVVKADHGREEPVVRYERVPEACGGNLSDARVMR